MKYRKLGNSDVKVSEFSIGCWTMGGLNFVDGIPNGWANVDEDEIVSAVKLAVDAGVNHFDNADVYGNGRAEQMLARVFDKLGLKSEDFVFASKVGHLTVNASHAYDPAHIRQQCEQSLINLKRDYIDIYYLHHGDFGENDEYLEPAAETLDALVKEGKIRIKGQSAYSNKQFKKAVPLIRPTVLQSWAHAMDTRFIREHSPVSDLLDEYDMSFVAFSPLNQGILLGKYSAKNLPSFEEGDHRKKSSKFTASYLEKAELGVSAMKERFGEKFSDLAGVALQFVVKHPRVACVIAGFRNSQQVECNLSMLQRELSEEDMAFIRGIFVTK